MRVCKTMDKLEEMNYRHLQQLAKAAGVRANLPKAELLRVLRDHQHAPTVSAAVATANSGSHDDDESLLNKTFEIEPEAEAANISSDLNDDSRITNDGAEQETLNRTFEIAGEEEEAACSRRKRSNRLSVTGPTVAALAKETASSPRLRAAAATAGPARLQVPTTSRRSVVPMTPRGALVANGRSSVAALVERLTTPSSTKRKQPEEGASNIPRFIKFAR